MNYKPGNPYYDKLNTILKHHLQRYDEPYSHHDQIINDILNALFNPNTAQGVDPIGDEWD